MIEVFELRVTILDEFQTYLGVGRRFAINSNGRHLGIYDTKMAARTGPLRKNKELCTGCQVENALTFYQILSTNSFWKCMETSLENLPVDVVT